MGSRTLQPLPRKRSSHSPKTAAIYGMNSNKVSQLVVPLASYSQAKREGYSGYDKSFFGVDYGIRPNADLSKVYYKMVDPIKSPSFFNETWQEGGTSPGIDFLIGAGFAAISIASAPLSTAITVGAVAYSGFTTAINSSLNVDYPGARQGDQLWMYHMVGVENGRITALWQYFLVDPYRNNKKHSGPGAYLIAERRTDKLFLHDSWVKK